MKDYTDSQVDSMKRALRHTMLLRKQQHAHDAPADIALQLWQNTRFADARTLLLYSALPDEVPTQQLLDQCVAQGKTVLLPRVTGPADMELRRYTGQHDLQTGAYGILEPTGPCFPDDADIDVAVIPGVAFDHEGHRLGRGRGYYDRFLARLHAHGITPFLIGLCFPWQLTDAIPVAPHDIRLDCIVC